NALRSDTFDDAKGALRGHNPCHLQAGFGKHGSKFLFGSFTAADNKHLNIEQLAPAWIVAGRDHVVGDQDPALFIHGSATISENVDALLVIPIVKNVLHDIGIASSWNLLKEISGFQGAALTNSSCSYVLVLLSARNNRGLIEQNSL